MLGIPEVAGRVIGFQLNGLPIMRFRLEPVIFCTGHIAESRMGVRNCRVQRQRLLGVLSRQPIMNLDALGYRIRRKRDVRGGQARPGACETRIRLGRASEQLYRLADIVLTTT